MSFSKVNAGGWPVNGKLTSSQINQLDTDHANALDKSVAGDTILGTVGFSGSGNISANQASSVKSLVSNGINTSVSGGIQSAAANGITSSTAQGITVTGLGSFVAPTPSQYLLSGAATLTRAILLPSTLTNNSNFTAAFNSITSAATGAFCGSNLTTGIADNCTVTQVVLYFKIHTGHAGLPGTKPTISILLMDITSGLLGTGLTLNSGDSGSGLTISSAGTVPLYENSGNLQTFTYTCNQNNSINRSKHILLANITDESGVNSLAGNIYIGNAVSYTIADMRPA